MKTNPLLTAPALLLREDDISAYAAHLYEQSGRIPNHDIENWLEAQACLAAHLERRRRGARRRRPRGFTMPASDASLWLEHDEGGSAEA